MFLSGLASDISDLEVCSSDVWVFSLQTSILTTAFGWAVSSLFQGLLLN